MARYSTKSEFMADLHHHIDAHCDRVVNTFGLLDDRQLQWQPSPKEWSILQCFEHLNLTHDYYIAKIEKVLPTAPNCNPDDDHYRPSFWGRIYMHFALNPNYTFPSPEPVAPQPVTERKVLATYLAKQEALLTLLDAISEVDLVKTAIPIEKFVRFNLGDCLKILVYHDELHIRQAQRVCREQAEQAHREESHTTRPQ